MKKTGYEIIGMIKDGKAPKKIKEDYYTFEYNENNNTYQNKDMSCIDLIQCLNEEFEIIEEPKVWKPKENEEYYVIDEYGHIQKNECLPEIMEKSYAIGNCFKTKEEAEKMLEKLKIYTQLKRYAEEHNEEEIDWENEKQLKVTFSYDFFAKEFVTYEYLIKDMCKIYFTSEDLCWKAIKEIGEDNIKKLFKEN